MKGSKRKIKVIIDTNIWISFLIGKRLHALKEHLVDSSIELIFTEQLFEEIQLVTKRKKLKKYFDSDKVDELLLLLSRIGQNINITPRIDVCKDPKDNFLLDLIEQSNADYLVTGDKDLIDLSPFKSANIITAKEFEKILK